MDALTQVKAIIGDHIGAPASTIADDATLDTLKLDSLDRVELGMALEEHFAIGIPDDAVDDVALGTVPGLVAYIDKRIAEKGNGLPCQVPPAGWLCTRADGHEGPCAAIPDPAFAVVSDDQPANIMSGVGARWAEDDCRRIVNGDTPSYPITRAELIRRGIVYPDGENMAIDVTCKLGWPTETNLLGTDPTHRLVAVADAETINASNVSGVVFRKKPVEIEAVRFAGVVGGVATFDTTGTNGQLPEWLVVAMAGPEGSPGSAWPNHLETDSLTIDTLEGAHMASPGDWIIRGLKGELYPCKPDIFAMTYDPVAPAASHAHGNATMLDEVRIPR